MFTLVLVFVVWLELLKVDAVSADAVNSASALFVCAVLFDLYILVNLV